MLQMFLRCHYNKRSVINGCHRRTNELILEFKQSIYFSAMTVTVILFTSGTNFSTLTETAMLVSIS